MVERFLCLDCAFEFEEWHVIKGSWIICQKCQGNHLVIMKCVYCMKIARRRFGKHWFICEFCNKHKTSSEKQNMLEKKAKSEKRRRYKRSEES